MPEGMDPLAQLAWKHLAPPFEKFGLLTEIDDLAMECLCEGWAAWQHARRDLARIRKRTRSRKNLRLAEVSVENAQKNFRLWCNEFGLTPAARGRLNLPTLPADDEDEFEKFLLGSRPARSQEPIDR
jgi:P27 family predicted phage terminase small subunit